MRLLRHLAVKDLRILRWPLLAWFVVIVARVIAMSVRADAALVGEGPRFALSTVEGLLGFADLALIALLVSGLVHADPVVGLDRFWMTRPIGAARLLGAKLSFAAIFLVAAPVLVLFVTAAVLLHSPGNASAVLTSALTLQLLWTLILLAFASATPTLGRLLIALAAAAGILATTVSLFAATQLSDVDGPQYWDTEVVNRSGEFLIPLLLLAAALVAIVEQYRTRRPLRSAVVGVGGIVLVIIVGVMLPRFAGPPVEPPLPGWAADQSTVFAKLDRSLPPRVDEISRAGLGPTGRKHVALPIRMTGLPAQYWQQAIAVRATLAFPDGKTIKSAQTYFVGGSTNYWTRLQSAVQPTRLLTPPGDNVHDPWPAVLVVSDEDYRRYGSAAGRLTMDLQALVHRLRVVGVLPLMERASTNTDRARFEVRHVLRRGTSVTIVLRQTAIAGPPSPAARTEYQFVLRNTRRGEAASGGIQYLGSNGGGGMPRALLAAASDTTRPVPFSDVLAAFPEPWATNQIDENWLADAELAIIDDEYAGRIPRAITVEEFRMKP
jgi:hypothetical protein